MARLADDEAKIATGKRLLRPSSDPLSTRLVLEFERMVSRNEQYISNGENGSRQLGLSDVALGKMEDLVIRAREIALEMLNATSTPGMRLSASIELKQLLEQVIDSGNTKHGDRYIFGGTETIETPFEFDGLGFVRYHGNDELQYGNISINSAIPINVPGSDAFGVRDVKFETVDLSPIASADTKLDDLNHGDGVYRGKFNVNLKIGASPTPQSWEVDISNADSLSDVVDIINDATNGIVLAYVYPNGHLALESTIGGALTVTEFPGSTTASDLNILREVWFLPNLEGGDLDPAVTESTKTSNLLNGTGLPGNGRFTITNGPHTQDFDFNTDITIGDMLDRINNADIGVTASINAEGTGINIVNAVSGTYFNITELGSTTAQDLGLLTLGMNKLVDLRGGLGIDTAPGPDETEDMRIQLHAGTSAAVTSSVTLGDFTSAALVSRTDIFPGQKIYFTSGANAGQVATIQTFDPAAGTVTFDPPAAAAIAAGDTFDIRTELDINIDGAETVQDIINIINMHSDNKYPIVRTINSSLAPNEFTSAAIVGRTDIVAGQKVVFMSGANAGMAATVLSYDFFTGRVTFEPQAGAAINPGDSFAIYSNSQLVTAGINATGDGFELTDNTITVSGLPGDNDFSISDINSSNTATDLGIQMSVPSGTDVITGNPLGAMGVASENVFTAFLTIKEGLAGDNETLISKGLALLEVAERGLLTSRADVGGRVQRVDLALNMLEDENLSIEGLLSEERDVNVAEVIVDFQLRQTMLQAALAATAQILGTSLLDFV
jgi:flagellin-like hook-associated protein FlgL